jgi:hypothetical protein
MTAALEARMHVLRHQRLDAARHLTGAKVLAAWLYGVGPVTHPTPSGQVTSTCGPEPTQVRRLHARCGRTPFLRGVPRPASALS